MDRVNMKFSRYLTGFLACFIFISFAAGSFAQSPISAQKITLDLKGIDIIDTLKIISQRTGMNIIASKSVTGKVTIFLKDVDVWDAFEIILLSNDLAYDVRNDIVNVMTGREYEAMYGEHFKDKKELVTIKLNYAKAVEVAKAVTQVKTTIGRVIVDEGSNSLILMDSAGRLEQMKEMVASLDSPTVTKVFTLDYAKSDKLNPKIQDMITKGLGSVRFDERTNTVVVTDLPGKVADIERIINAFDEKTRQVLIDAKIVQVELDDKLTTGIDWQTILKKVTVDQKLTANLTSGGTLTISTGFGDGNTFNSVIQALKLVGNTKIISSPRITALDGQEAKIMVGTKEAYITGTTTTPAAGAVTTAESVNFVDVGIQLYVTPSVNKDGYVSMKIRPVVSSVGSRIKTTASPDGVPIVKTSEAETSVVVKDGVTIVMGGLIEDTKIRTVNKLPILGDIPFFGAAFRNVVDETKKTELVIFLTPTIISGDTSQPIPNMKDSSYSDYYGSVRDRIVNLDLYNQMVRTKILNTALRSMPQEKLTGNAVVAFSLFDDGSLFGEPVIINKAEPALADLAIKSVKDSTPFPPFPKDLGKGTKAFKITLSFE
ncbi:MAG: secretin N-terminal domain-containing protein [Candidatus Omnitrophica bacterium]|nr:secretin N-terminal domain-containing protein [Candidatus Omnitrophota bacterium]MDD5310323.1 secretin N-terminal domain-containing protein [Candidatus Omnitrophota bacterium]MDD5545868.1 secretin N-terminal domain-containing protein [Candidatus Omnitrophota bacterium]